ncbi:tetratricopeptide repeat protein [Nostoc spongiaeforme FACHB-130]|uniref:Tetratricopeptide repeat protein n=1 Tax=Nostoc spongiaeforme FACHB-130 TaxID=1357510 RepID=A0ABR8G2E5_9NOSO|nr:tetratricopeptide repeat protein [Nostoc spongiaeforme]MBD2597366.1 tetratricopeptide repeat protein [Nostoc spongiaeforme FACHB-130]
MQQRHFFPSAHTLNSRSYEFWLLKGITTGRRGDHFPFFSFFFLLLTFLLTPIAANASDITQQLHRPINSSSWQYDRDEADSLLRIGEQQYRSGNAAKTIDSCLQALEIYHSIGDVRATGLTYELLAKAYIQQERYKEGEEALRRRLAIARDSKDFQAQIFALNNIAAILLQKDETVAAGKAVQEALTIAQGVNNIEGQGLSLSNLGLVTARLGDYNKAIKLYETAISYRRQKNDPIGEANTLNNLGDAYLAAGNYPDTIGAYGLAMRLARLNGDRNIQLRAIDGLVKAHTSVGRNERAFELLQERLVIAQELQNLPEQLKSFESYAAFYERLGNYATAKNFYERAIAIANTLEDTKRELVLKDRLTKLQKKRN